MTARRHPRPRAAAPPHDWRGALQALGAGRGYFESLGADHAALFIDDGPRLIVTFEDAQTVNAGRGHATFGQRIAAVQGWSHLCLVADGPTFYRDDTVFRFFDRLVADAFFEDFDHVLIYGAGMGAYAAAAFSVTAPGATVVAVQPVATLDPAVTGWDPRLAPFHRLAASHRYRHAPDMIEGAGDVFIVFDPCEPLDAAQAALFDHPFVQPLYCRTLGPQIEDALRRMGMLDAMLLAAGAGRLSASQFHDLYRARRRDGVYLDRLYARLRFAGKTGAALCIARRRAALR